MPAPGTQSRSTRRTLSPVARALLLSLLLHLVIFGLLELNVRLAGVADRFLPEWLRARPAEASLALRANQTPAPKQPTEPPLLFVDVDPRTATTEAPKDSKFYSALNSQSASPIRDPDKDASVPKIDGKQTQIPKTVDVPRERSFPLQPSPPPQPLPEDKLEQAKPPEAPQPPVKPSGGQTEGEMTLAKASKIARPTEGEPRETPPTPPHTRPRTIAEAKQQREQGGLAGQKMNQEGGAKKYALNASFDVRATPFGAYDAAIIAAIQKRWYDLLDSTEVARTRTGKVVLKFYLNSNGSVSNFEMKEYEVGEVLALICERAVRDPAPYAAWPSDLRRLVGSDHREVTFTFYYN